MNPFIQASDEASALVNRFHVLYYHSLGWDSNHYHGYQIKQCAFDLQVYQELITGLRPRFVLQTGVAGGGSLLYFAHLLDNLGMDPSCLVVGIDIQLTEQVRTLRHPRIRLIEGSSTASTMLDLVRLYLGDCSEGLVSLDSDHSCAHVLAECQIYNQFVGVGSYLVVEDTNINGHPVFPAFGPGPFEAVQLFLQGNRDFVVDDAVWQRNLFSFHQHGWLRRISPSVHRGV